MIEVLENWITKNKPDDDLLWKNGFYDQVLFVNNDVSYLLSRSYEEKLGVRQNIKVVSTHTSKSVLLPVFQIDCHKIQVTMRYNFHDWKISYLTYYDSIPVVKFGDLFDIHKQINPIYCEGFRENWVYSSYAENPKKFTAELAPGYNSVYVFFWLIRQKLFGDLRNQKPKEVIEETLVEL